MYATQQNMIDRFGTDELIQLTDRANANAIGVTVLDQALADATGEIDGYLASKQQLPLSPVPRIITGYCCDIARYRLYDNRATEQVEKRYETALRFLRMVSKGEVSLGVDAAGAAPAAAGAPAVVASPRVFTRESLDDFSGAGRANCRR